MHQNRCQQLINDALRCADKIGIAVNISIYDQGANLLSFQRMAKAPLGSIDVALKKGHSAVLFGAPTEALGELARDQQLTGFEQTNNGLILFAGGEPVYHDNQLIGGIGISGGSAAQDKEIALFAISQLLNTLSSKNTENKNES